MDKQPDFGLQGFCQPPGPKYLWLTHTWHQRPFNNGSQPAGADGRHCAQGKLLVIALGRRRVRIPDRRAKLGLGS
ncbi:MAG: hypothetical protein B6D64_11330 [Bacteroidetes bacterium 4484_276]|nr:MAG: hypothetical protein B6D64_11330 [Bacteroidetes bacterium 4484_276]